MLHFAKNINTDLVFFLSLMKYSLSLSARDKAQVIEKMPTLSQHQVDSLIEVWIEEIQNLDELNRKYPQDIDKLIARCITQWDIVEQFYDMPPLLSPDRLQKIVNEQYLNDLQNNRLDFQEAHEDVREDIEADIEADDKHAENETEDSDDVHDSETVVEDDSQDESSELLSAKKVKVEAPATEDTFNDSTSDSRIIEEGGVENIENIEGVEIEEEEYIESEDPNVQEMLNEWLDRLTSSEASENDSIHINNDNKDASKSLADHEPQTYLNDDEEGSEHRGEHGDKQQRLSLAEKLATYQNIANKKPRTSLSITDILEQLNHNVIGQEDALKRLVVAVHYHKRHSLKVLLHNDKDEDTKLPYLRQAPILLIGNTGTGKTHMVKQVCQAYDITPVIIDASCMVANGIVGTSIDSVGRRIYDAANGDMEVAKHAVVFLDEFDKLFVKTDEYHMGSKLNVALQLLTIMEGSAPLSIERHSIRDSDKMPTHIDTQHMLFILGGSFGLQQRDLNATPMGFLQQEQTSLASYDPAFLSKLGLPDELAGRIGQMICLESLTNHALADILRDSPTSPWQVFVNQLALMNCDAILPNHVVDALIDENQEQIQQFGARGLYQAFNRLPCLTEFLMQAAMQEEQVFVIELPEGYTHN